MTDIVFVVIHSFTCAGGWGECEEERQEIMGICSTKETAEQLIQQLNKTSRIAKRNLKIEPMRIIE